MISFELLLIILKNKFQGLFALISTNAARYMFLNGRYLYFLGSSSCNVGNHFDIYGPTDYSSYC